jgi:hypothetical protein
MDKVAVLRNRIVEVFQQVEQRGFLPGGKLFSDSAPAARLFGLVCHGLNPLGWTRFNGDNDSGETIRVMLRACPGMRRMKPRLSSVSTIECTLGGVI